MTQDELQQIKGIVNEVVGGLRDEINNEMSSQINGLRGELSGQISGLRDEIKNEMSSQFGAVLEAVNDGFTGMQEQFDELKANFNGLRSELSEVKSEVDKCAKIEQVLNWGDNKIIPLECDVERLKYVHQKELEGLPSQREISETLAERGFKQRLS